MSQDRPHYPNNDFVSTIITLINAMDEGGAPEVLHDYLEDHGVPSLNTMFEDEEHHHAYPAILTAIIEKCWTISCRTTRKLPPKFYEFFGPVSTYAATCCSPLMRKMGCDSTIQVTRGFYSNFSAQNATTIEIARLPQNPPIGHHEVDVHEFFKTIFQNGESARRHTTVTRLLIPIRKGTLAHTLLNAMDRTSSGDFGPMNEVLLQNGFGHLNDFVQHYPEHFNAVLRTLLDTHTGTRWPTLSKLYRDAQSNKIRTTKRRTGTHHHAITCGNDALTLEIYGDTATKRITLKFPDPLAPYRHEH